MIATYLFQIDGAKDNDAAFVALRVSQCHVYRGVDLKVGKIGWAPDLVHVTFDEDAGKYSLRLIELEATEPNALISCRKYLPESSESILSEFKDYLQRVIRECRSRADSREHEFEKLIQGLSRAKNITITTVGALRSDAKIVEELALFDQPKLCIPQQQNLQNQQSGNRPFKGELVLSADDAKAYSRCIMILDAKVRGFDCSDATLHSWRGQDRSQPLKYLLKKDQNRYPFLFLFIMGASNRGIKLDCEKILDELSCLWSAHLAKPPDRERVRNSLERYFPESKTIKSHDRMPVIFDHVTKLFDNPIY